MPRIKDPVAELAAHRKKEAAFRDKAKLLEEQAAGHLGRKLMDRGIHTVDAKIMDDVLDRIAKLGAGEALRRLSNAHDRPSPPETTAGPNGDAKEDVNAKLMR
jgi:hypothetical protein